MSDLFDLTGKRVVITGGTSGIGLATARAFLEAGAQVLISGRSVERGQQALTTLEGRGPAWFAAGDAADESDAVAVARAAEERMGGTDAIVCAAGMNRRGAPQDLSLEDWDAVVDASLRGTFVTARAFYPGLCKAGQGRIVTVGSMLSVLANEATAPYAAAKGGVVQLTRSLAVAWAKDGIRANCILPGWVDTPLTRQARKDMPDLDRRVCERTPVGRWATPDEIAGAILFLATPAAGFMTGTAIPVDGGYLMRA
ncbi:gluconate 5-dehydrogenase [Roseovarius sp. A-2]|uniref:SDR family NAD(P)-dependent oxidoreductase n=1 Tax=Roseovarius sp. A-2 TaxID=1570360 RepID=UPI0009B544E3|nr:SDR family NAD(P)-dependent oxidoreductase [Roseovarius sp. A-2]GAW33126.1 gluconate 5-dehydrogenase [Roseovarius sp. A-2]